VIDGQAVDKRAKLRGLCAFDRWVLVAQLRNKVVDAGLGTAEAHCGNEGDQPFLPARMADDISLELEVQRHAPPVAEQRGQMLD
jgi:hypothetical protein